MPTITARYMPHAQIGEVIGVRGEKVKVLIHQARTTLIAERDARERPCEDVREQIATARGGALRRGPLRRHLRRCPPCRAYRDAIADQRRVLALALPVVPSAGLKAGVLGAASTAAAGGAAAGGASLGGGLAAKVVASALVVGTATGGGVAVVELSEPAPRKAAVEKAPVAAPAPPRAVSRPATPATDAGSAASATPRRRGSRRAAGRRGRSKARPRRAARPLSSSGRGRRALAHARARGQAGRTPKAPGSSRSLRAPAKKPKPAKPVRPVRPVKPVTGAKRVHPARPLAPAAPAQERRAATRKAKTR